MKTAVTPLELADRIRLHHAQGRVVIALAGAPGSGKSTLLGLLAGLDVPTSGGVSIFRVLDPYPGAIESLQRLSRRHRIVIVTTKPAFAVHDTFAWLAEHRVPTTEVHIVDDKTSVACDVYLEDADHNLEQLRAAHRAALVCRFVRPWNLPHEGVVDVTEWLDFEELLGETV